MGQEHSSMSDVPNPTGDNDPSVTEADIREVMDVGKRYLSSEIEEALGKPKSTINYRLNRLADEGVVEKHKPGHRSVLWELVAESEGRDE